jgi:hypothetical protein
VRHLDRHVSVQLLIVSQIDKAEAPFAQYLLNAVATDPLGMIDGRIVTRQGGIPVVVLCNIIGGRVVQAAVLCSAHYRFRKHCPEAASDYSGVELRSYSEAGI